MKGRCTFKIRLIRLVYRVDVSKKNLGRLDGEGGGDMVVVLLWALQNFLFQIISVKMRDEVPLSGSWDKVGIEGISSQLNPN